VATLAVTGRADLSDAQWAVLEPLLPRGTRSGRPPKWTKRQLIDGIRWRIRAGTPWRDVPPAYGPWQAVYGLFRRWQRNGTWMRILAGLQTRADAAGLITWDVSVDSTVARAHQHAAGARKRGICKPNRPAVCAMSRPITGWAGPAAACPPRFTWPPSRDKNPCPFSSLPGSAATAPSSPPSWTRSRFPAGAGPTSDPPGPGARRQGLRIPRQPRLPAQTWHRLHHP
jgi:transposase